MKFLNKKKNQNLKSKHYTGLIERIALTVFTSLMPTPVSNMENAGIICNQAQKFSVLIGKMANISSITIPISVAFPFASSTSISSIASCIQYPMRIP